MKSKEKRREDGRRRARLGGCVLFDEGRGGGGVVMLGLGMWEINVLN
jgi:hydrogenase maturation factor HypE